MHINYEFKARHKSIADAEALLLTLQPRFVGEDQQVDTYYDVGNGRMKLRKGNIEHSLIFYQRTNTAGAKQSDVILYQLNDSAALAQILSAAVGVKTVVSKKRKIYFIDNVKFHFDRVDDLGEFVEVEAIDSTGDIGIEKLKAQCLHYQHLFSIQPEDFIASSYSDMLLAKKSSIEK